MFQKRHDTSQEKNVVILAETHDSLVETHRRTSLQIDQQTDDESQQKDNGIAYRPPKSISSFIAGFKSAATKRINEFSNMPGFPVWQTQFHDRIVRDEVEYWKIVRYIKLNPEK